MHYCFHFKALAIVQPLDYLQVYTLYKTNVAQYEGVCLTYFIYW